MEHRAYHIRYFIDTQGFIIKKLYLSRYWRNKLEKLGEKQQEKLGEKN